MDDQPLRVAIAARVVDNFGDAGVAWRLARQLSREHACDATLWIDDASVLARFVPGADRVGAAVGGVRIQRLPPRAATSAPPLAPWPQVCVETFGCGLPTPWLDAMAAAPAPPVWINLEYLSAEDWVDGAHGLPSPQLARPLTRWFFYPGFTPRTGGLLRERDLLARRDAFRANPALRSRAGTEAALPAPASGALAVSLFCYPNAAVAALLAAWSQGAEQVHVLVPEGVASGEVASFLGAQPHAGAVRKSGALTLAVVPFVDPEAFDRRLWACDFAVVRGEDSFVRAQWAARPFAWHIYPQDDEAHRVKLDAFLRRYTAGLEAPAAAALDTFTHTFERANGAGVARAWPALRAALPALQEHAARWAAGLAEIPDLATQLVAFARARLQLPVPRRGRSQ